MTIYDEKKDFSVAAMHAWMFPQIQQVARIYGYAVAIHGSMSRDLDLIAVPWTDAASSAEVVVEAIRESVDGFIRKDEITDGNKYDERTRNPNGKPHGRRAWSIYFSGRRFYIDLSVMPRIVTGAGE